MPSRGFLLTVLVLAIVGYLGLWPVPIAPIAWDAPSDNGLTGPFAANDRLADLDLLDLGEFHGPEDVALGPDNLLYVSTENGSIVRLDPHGRNVEEFAVTGGRPLGVEFDRNGNLLVANATRGLQRVRPDGSVETLFDEFGGEPLVYANDLAIADDGRIYLTESTTKFAAAEWGGTYEASVLDILEHSGKGRLYEYDPATDAARIVLVGINFANGVAISEDQRFLLIAETGSYRVWRYWLSTERVGQAEVVIDNLPGFPDNINRGRDGRFWIGLVAPRDELLDRMADTPIMRSIVLRLPEFVRPAARPSTHLIAVDGDGTMIASLQDSGAGLPLVTGAAEYPGGLFLSSLRGKRIGVVRSADVPELADAGSL